MDWPKARVFSYLCKDFVSSKYDSTSTLHEGFVLFFHCLVRVKLSFI